MEIHERRKENLRRLMRERYGNKQVALAAACGISPGYASFIFTDRKKVGESLARAIEDRLGLPTRALDVDPDSPVAADIADGTAWLAARGKRLQSGSRAVSSSVEIGWGDSSTLRGLPSPQAGGDPALSLLHIQRVEGTVTTTEQGYQWEQEAPDERYPFPAAWLRARGYQAEHCRLLQIESSAMAPRYQAGDVVLINLQDRAPQHGKVYAVAVAGRTELRRLLQHYAGGWELRADNPSPLEPAQQIPAEAIDQVPIIGRVVWRGGEE